MTTCSGPNCDALVVWAKTNHGKFMLLDAVRDAAGQLVPLETEDGNAKPTGRRTRDRRGGWVPVVEIIIWPHPDELWYRPHFATCPDAAEFKR